MHKQFHSKVSRFGATAFSFNNPNTNYRYSGLFFFCWIQAIFYCLGCVICGANERWLLIYKKKLSDKSKRWIIYSARAEKTAFHSVFHAKCHMNSKRTKEFGVLETKFIGRNEKRREEKSQYCCDCSLLKERRYDPAVLFFYIDLNREIN